MGSEMCIRDSVHTVKKNKDHIEVHTWYIHVVTNYLYGDSLAVCLHTKSHCMSVFSGPGSYQLTDLKILLFLPHFEGE